MEAGIGKREQKKLLAKNKITDAAIEKFAQKGFQLTSVADIMQSAGMGLGTFYNYFYSKEELLHYLLDRLAIQLREHMEQLQGEKKSQADILREMIMLTAELVGSNKYLLPLFLSAGEKNMATEKEEQMGKHAGKTAGKQAEGEQEAKPHAPAFIIMFLQLVQAGQAAGEFRRDIPAPIITEMFHSLFQAAAFSSLPVSFEENIRLKLKLMIDGICVKENG